MQYLRWTVAHSLLLCSSSREGRECGEDGIPLVLADVLDDVVHVSRSP